MPSGIAIRVDSGHPIGSGHVMRTLTLAEELRSRGASVCFICRERAGDLRDVIASRGFTLVALPAHACSQGGEHPHAGWLGAPWTVDAEETRSAIATLAWRPAWLIADHYEIDRRWESELRPLVDRIMTIDDLADRDHDCDLLLDQNLLAGEPGRYSGRISSSCVSLLGPRFALLQPVYADLHSRMPARAGAVRRIFLFFGGEDRTGLTRRALAAVLRACGPDVAIDVVLGSGCAADGVDGFADPQQVTFHSRVNSLAPLIARADLGLGAGGATTWERLCLGLPTVVVTRAQNQRPIAAELHRRGLVRWLGDEEEATDAEIEQSIRALLASGLDGAWSERCLGLVDGRGLTRVCDTMLVGSADALRARHAAPGDEALLLAWANDPVTRGNGFSSDPISPDAHHVWFDRRLRDVDRCHLYVVETEHGTPVGQVRFEKAGVDWQIHYALSAAFRGRGLGRTLLRTALRQLYDDTGAADVFGRVKVSNVASMRIFAALGFVGEPESAAVVTFRGRCQ